MAETLDHLIEPEPVELMTVQKEVEVLPELVVVQ